MIINRPHEPVNVDIPTEKKEKKNYFFVEWFTVGAKM